MSHSDTPSDAAAATAWGGYIRSVATLSGVLMVVNLIYATPKYVFFEHVGWSHFPLYVLNKTLSMLAIELIVIGFVIGPFARLSPDVFGRFVALRGWICVAGFGAGAWHALMSLALLNPSYYKKLFDETGRMTGLAELGILQGIVAFLLLALLGLTSVQGVRQAMVPAVWRSVQSKGVWALGLLALHNAFIGAKGWMNPEKWTLGWMPPITLLMCALIVIAIVIRWLPRLLDHSRTAPAAGHAPAVDAEPLAAAGNQRAALGQAVVTLLAFGGVAALCIMAAAGIHAIYLHGGPDVEALRVLPYPNLWAPSLFLDMEYSNSLARLGQPLLILLVACAALFPVLRLIRQDARRLSGSGTGIMHKTH